MRDVAIVGVGQSVFVRNYVGNIKELAFEAFKESVEDSNLEVGDIDASVICSAPEYDLQRSPSGVITEYLGLNPKPTFYVETLCSSGNTGLKLAYSMVRSGLHDVVAVLGFQKMSDISSSETQERMGRGADVQWESPFGTMMPAYYAMYARAYMSKYDVSLEDLSLVRVKASTYGQINDRAVYRKFVSLENLLDSNSVMSNLVSTPLRVGDCCANADGSSCIIVANYDKAKKFYKKPVVISGIGSATASVNLAGRDLFTGLSAARIAANQAYKMAKLNSKDINVAEVHDCFTIAELMAYEDLGFIEYGRAKDLIRNKETYLDGRIPINIDGGLLSKGHPIGATGGSQIRTIVKQLRNEGKEIQVPKPKHGLIHNIGGVGIYGNVTILSV